MQILPDNFTFTLPSDETAKVICRPGICLVFYMSEPLRVVAPPTADAIRRFLSLAPPSTLRSYYARNGYYKSLTAARLTNSLKMLSNLPKGYVGHLIDFSGGLDGNVGDYAVFFQAFQPNEFVPGEVNILRFEFPHNIVELIGVDCFLEFVIDIAKLIPFQCGNAGYSLKGSRQHDAFSYEAILRLLPRYLGFDSWYTKLRYHMQNCVPTAHWINLLNKTLLEKLGGFGHLRRKLPDADIRELAHGVFIRSARFPPVGDTNRRALDIGLLPELARFTKPLRSHMEQFVGRTKELDAQAWFARFDNLESRPWSNDD